MCILCTLVLRVVRSVNLEKINTTKDYLFCSSNCHYPPNELPSKISRNSLISPNSFFKILKQQKLGCMYSFFEHTLETIGLKSFMILKSNWFESYPLFFNQLLSNIIVIWFSNCPVDLFLLKFQPFITSCTPQYSRTNHVFLARFSKYMQIIQTFLTIATLPPSHSILHFLEQFYSDFMGINPLVTCHISSFQSLSLISQHPVPFLPSYYIW